MSDPTDENRSSNADKIRSWLCDAAIPLWLDNGIDANGGFHEVLDLSAVAVPADKRLRTMARQTYCFATSVTSGWHRERSAAAVDHGITYLNRQVRTANGGFAKTCTFDGLIKDETRDSYDYAFVLFAAAAAARAGNKAALVLGHEVFRQLDEDFYLGNGRGYRETTGSNDDVRRANPHMHLLEAFTAWARVTGDARAADRAGQIVSLFHSRFFDQDTWSLREMFGSSLEPLAGERGDVREPGHHYEWAWLLHDFAAPDDPLVRWAGRRLYATAKAFGTNPVTGLSYHAVSRHGDPLIKYSRSWSLTEAVRATVALTQQGLPGFSSEVEKTIDLLFCKHLAPAPDGMWIDHIGSDGSIASETVPASILYHLIGAFTCYLNYMER